MKKLFILIATVMLVASVFAQAPQKMSYQAVIRNSSEALVTNTTVGMQISILQGSASGTAVYVETQSPTTNANGLVSFEIGVGTVVSGDFTTIDWANGTYFIKTETDPAGGTSYTIAGVSQLLSVPYALHAKTAETVTGGITETDPTFTSSQAANIDANDITNLGNLSGVNTGDQDLSTLATKTALGDSTAQVRSEIPDVSGFLTSYTETDPTFTGSQAANITATDITNLGNLSGVNTGDQDLSTLATKAYVDALLARIEALEESDVLNNGFIDSRDGNEYNWVQIGDQVWMAENLAYLPSVNMVADGSEDAAGSYYYVYGYDGTNVADAKATDNYATYGVLYNWTAAMDGEASSTTNPSGIQGVCPAGWHLPSDAEWTELTDYLGGTGAGGKLKETGTTHWNSPNTGATNEIGFTALPGGTRNYNGAFYDIGNYGNWWSATELNATYAWNRIMSYAFSDVYRDYDGKEVGFSVRCLRD